MVYPKYRDAYRLTRDYQCPCRHAFRSETTVWVGVFPGVQREEDDGAYRSDFRPDTPRWLYIACYEDAQVAEASEGGIEVFAPRAPLPDFCSVTTRCPTCGRTLPPERCPDCDAPAELVPRDRQVGAESDFEWDYASFDLVCPNGHSRLVLRQQDDHKGN